MSTAGIILTTIGLTGLVIGIAISRGWLRSRQEPPDGWHK